MSYIILPTLRASPYGFGSFQSSTHEARRNSGMVYVGQVVTFVGAAQGALSW